MAIKMPSQQEFSDAMDEQEVRAAIDRYEQMIESGYDDSEALWYNLGVHYMTIKEWEKARDTFLKALELSPDLLQALVNLGGVYFHLNEYKKAEKFNRKALEINPDFIHARSNLAMSLMSQGNFKETISQLEQVLKMEPKHPIALVSMSRAHAALGNEEKMKEYQERAKEVGVKFV
ncbi:tetratricopeptide repeat protein [bacterium]|nr:tetratricopeptide repeat protein [bacterium]